ncbi:MAG TPA: isoprenylcysteine carboxylmethyltransferase family protein, partial [Planctomycetota bacterium]|nr:isoprenylcysteine carboxylmethyltransferase family protein [Planctomycetota bacterium]
ERRLRGGPTAEKERTQKFIMLLTSLGFVGLLVVSGLDRRFGWSEVPLPLVVVGDFLVALGFAVVFRVYRENPFTSATIELANDQRVISTGPYAIVRHPMYSGGLVLLVGMSPALGSFWGLSVLAVMLPSLIWRLVEEEKFLVKNLPGYVEYREKVHWRLVPRVF